MDNIKDYIKVFNVLDTKQCQNILNILNGYDWEKHKWNNYKTGKSTSEPTKELDITYPTKFLEKEMAKVISNALLEYQNYFIFEERNKDKNLKYFLHKSTPVRFNRYPTGTMMRKHYDHIHSIFEGENKGVPIVSIVGVLNDDYEGGDFVFNGNHEVKLKTGDILIFPSNFLYAHEVKEITKGTRYSYVSWAF
tara:strand:+ start:103 stop:681 length:579 start_codon:yes stop_codon:yes gene_type:complete